MYGCFCKAVNAVTIGKTANITILVADFLFDWYDYIWLRNCNCEYVKYLYFVAIYCGSFLWWSSGVSVFNTQSVKNLLFFVIISKKKNALKIIN